MLADFEWVLLTPQTSWYKIRHVIICVTTYFLLRIHCYARDLYTVKCGKQTTLNIFFISSSASKQYVRTGMKPATANTTVFLHVLVISISAKQYSRYIVLYSIVSDVAILNSINLLLASSGEPNILPTTLHSFGLKINDVWKCELRRSASDIHKYHEVAQVDISVW